MRVKIISGDAGPVVEHLVETLALPAHGMLTGDQIAALTEAALIARVEDTDLFVRVSPDQKSRIVRALRRRGHTVGFLGDGINDAPAIHAADVGLSVEGGTDVARVAADIILLAPDLNVLAEGVGEGRRTYANIMKYIRMGTSSNFGNMLSMAVASLLLPFLPLAPLQILLNNLIYDLSEIGIPFDSADVEDPGAAPKNWDMREVLRFTLIMGPLSSLFDAATFATLWFGLSCRRGGVPHRLVRRIDRHPDPGDLHHPHGEAGVAESGRTGVLVATSLGGLVVALLLSLTPIGGFFGFAGPAAADLRGDRRDQPRLSGLGRGAEALYGAPVATHGTSTAAPWNRPALRSASASLAAASG